MEITVFFDGAIKHTNGSIGVLGFGVAIYFDQDLAYEIYGVAPFDGTSNDSEWYACCVSLTELMLLLEDDKREHKITFKGDSKLIINQMNNEWNINEKFLEFHNFAQIYKKILGARFRWVGRQYNQIADKLSKQALKNTQQTFSKTCYLKKANTLNG